MIRTRKFLDRFRPPAATEPFESVLYPPLYETGSFEGRYVRQLRVGATRPNTYLLVQPRLGGID